MSYLHKYWVYIVLLPFIISCFEKDKQISSYPGKVYTINDNIEKYQTYFDFETGNIIKVIPVDEWQLGFECGKDGWHILVNSGTQWLINNTQQTNMDSAFIGSVGDHWTYDKQYYFPDSTAVGNWVIRGNSHEYTKNVYLLGKYSGSSYTDIKKLVFLDVNDSLYHFYYSETDSSFRDTVEIRKADSVNFVYYSFNSRKPLYLEPNKSRYDLVFCPYYDLATEFGVTIPYLVRGVLLNTNNTKACLDSIEIYNNIDIASLDKFVLLDQRDVIGYRWKEVYVDVNSGTASYLVRKNYSYLIRTNEGHYFKMHFLSYTLNGSSGYPQFEYSLLK
jgi:hypothetical protein